MIKSCNSHHRERRQSNPWIVCWPYRRLLCWTVRWIDVAWPSCFSLLQSSSGLALLTAIRVLLCFMCRRAEENDDSAAAEFPALVVGTDWKEEFFYYPSPLIITCMNAWPLLLSLLGKYKRPQVLSNLGSLLVWDFPLSVPFRIEFCPDQIDVPHLFPFYSRVYLDTYGLFFFCWFTTVFFLFLHLSTYLLTYLTHSGCCCGLSSSSYLLIFPRKAPSALVDGIIFW